MGLIEQEKEIEMGEVATKLDAPNNVIQAPQNDAASLMEVITRAAKDPSTDVDKLERLMSMYERVTDKRAEQAFTSAMNSAQKEMPMIAHNAKNTHANSQYADLATISKGADPVIQKYGFSLSFGTAKSDIAGHYRVTCEVSHADGCIKHFYADIPADTAGAQGKANKNATQGFGSTMTYGRRYLKCLIFDIQTADKDDDGLTASKAELPRMSSDRAKRYVNFQRLTEDIDNATDRVLSNLEAFIADECNWMPNGWQRTLLDRVRERDRELENRTDAAVSANETLDRQFKDTIG